jgi:hypothetical protein
MAYSPPVVAVLGLVGNCTYVAMDWRRIFGSIEAGNGCVVGSTPGQLGSALPVRSATRYFAYQSGQFGSAAPIRFSCSP